MVVGSWRKEAPTGTNFRHQIFPLKGRQRGAAGGLPYRGPEPGDWGKWLSGGAWTSPAVRGRNMGGGSLFLVRRDPLEWGSKGAGPSGL